MAALLLRLKNVPEDEYQDVCALLEKHDIAFYETNVGFWGVGMAAIWLQDKDQLAQAHDILNEYMQTRQASVQAEYEKAKQLGQVRTLLSTFLQQPITFVLYVAAILGILTLSLLPFLGLATN
ncbi:MAG: hypothetical protein HWE18_09170 [Gammaproteobacteria bacterium]|nr:hypothetical protein [Gammaproteobacteria bacterium]